MKKSIAYSSLSTSQVQFLEKVLRESKIEGGQELGRQFEDLKESRSSSLILEMADADGVVENRDSLQFGDMEIAPRYRRVIIAGEEVSLTPKEYDILYFLAVNRGEIFTKEQIYRAVWEEEYLMDDSNIMSFIRKLRKKIEPNPDEPKYILTVWGIGYKFNEKV